MKRFAIVLGAVAALALSGPALAQAPIVIKFSHVVAPNTPKGKGSLKFQELAEKYTNGKVKVEVYPNSQLYKDNEELQALQLGSVQMLAPSLAKFGPLGIKEFEVFDLPFIFKDQAAFRAVTDGPVGADLVRKLQAKGIRGMADWDNGFRIMTANRPLQHGAGLDRERDGAGKDQGQRQDHGLHAHDRRDQRVEEGADAGPPGDGRARGPTHDRRRLQGRGLRRAEVISRIWIPTPDNTGPRHG